LARATGSLSIGLGSRLAGLLPSGFQLRGTVDILCGADQIPETVVVTTLRASCGSHHPIMITPIGSATGLMAIAGPDRLKRRELAHKSPECRENQLGIPLKVGGRVIGAIGVSGGTPDQVHEVASAGADAFATFLRSDRQGLWRKPAGGSEGGSGLGQLVQRIKLRAAGLDETGTGGDQAADIDLAGTKLLFEFL